MATIPSGHEPANGPMQEPSNIRGELLRLRPGKQHAVIKSVQKPLFRYPFLFVDQDTMHDRDLAGGSAKAQYGDAHPNENCLIK